VEVSALNHRPLPGLRGPAPLLRLQSDERLVALVRRGHHGAFEALVSRYETRLLAFCRHMLGSREDAEDVLQEVFAAAFNAMLADEREINVRPWLYRIARNRSLNHLRRTAAIGVDSMDVHFADQGQSTGDKVFKREAFRQLIDDVQRLPETQRTALLLREIDALSYDQISEAMETTVPSVKSLLVRARISLAEAAEARKLTCDEVRLELGEVAEGLKKTTSPVRRHVRECDRCDGFRKQLKANNRTMAAVFPVGALLVAKKLVLGKFGLTASAGGAQVGGATAAAGAGAGAAGAGAAGATASGGASIVAGALATKAVAGLAAAALVTAGAVAVNGNVGASTHVHHSHPTLAATRDTPPPVVAAAEAVVPSPVIVRSISQRLSGTRVIEHRHTHANPVHKVVATPVALLTHTHTVSTATTTSAAKVLPAPTTQVQSDVTVLPSTPAAAPAPPASTPAVIVPAPPVVTTTSSTETPTPVVTPPQVTATAPAPAPVAPVTTTSLTVTASAPPSGSATATTTAGSLESTSTTASLSTTASASTTTP